MGNHNRFIIGKDKTFSIDTYKTQRNNNILICGSPGTGKTRSYLLPNLLNENLQSYVLVDIKGDLLRKTAPIFKERGYDIQIFNLKNLEQSEQFNMFDYIHSDTDVSKIVEIIIGPHVGNNDPFWNKSAKMLLQAIFFYLIYECPAEDRNMSNVIKLIQCAEIKEEREDYKSTLDIMFEDVKKRDPEHIAVKMYKAFKSGAAKTMMSIIISLNADLFLYNLQSIRNLTSKSTIDFTSIGMKKTIVYIILDDYDNSLYPIANLFLTQLFQTLLKVADEQPTSQLKYPVHCFLDDFCAYRINGFDHLIACARSRGIGISVFLQSESQLESIYGPSKAKTIINCCDTYLYLGGSDLDTCHNIAKRAKRTVRKIIEMPIHHLFVFRRGESSTFTKIFDIEHSTIPKLIKEAEGTFKIDDYVDIVHNAGKNHLSIKHPSKNEGQRIRRYQPRKSKSLDDLFLESDILTNNKTHNDFDDVKSHFDIDQIIEDYEFEKQDRENWHITDGIPQVNGIKFEQQVLNILIDLGFKGYLTPKSNDFGADIIVTKNNKKYAIQVKHRDKDKVLIAAVQEVIGAVGYYEADQGIVISNGHYTLSARKLASKNNVILINGTDLNEIRNMTFE